MSPAGKELIDMHRYDSWKIYQKMHNTSAAMLIAEDLKASYNGWYRSEHLFYFIGIACLEAEMY